MSEICNGGELVSPTYMSRCPIGEQAPKSWAVRLLMYATSEQYLTRAAAAARTRTQRPGKHLAVHASELVVKPFKSFDDIVDHCCYAWNTLIDQPWKIMSIARRDWAAVGHSI